MDVMEMEQQLEPQLPKKQVWVERVEEDEEEEPGVGLIARQSRNPTNGGVGTILTSTFATTDEPEPEPEPEPAKETASQRSEEEEEKGEEADNSCKGNQELGDVNEEDRAVKVEAGDATTNSVYFDKLQGIWKCRHCNWTHQIGSPCILDVHDETKGSESINGVSEIPKGPRMEINHQRVENAPAEQLHEETDTSFEHCENATGLDANTDLTGEIEEDLLDLDVETVVKKQNTHDFYCPNCRSCITRTVILRRRKPKISHRPKPKPKRKLDPIPAPVADLPKIDSNDIPTTPAPVVQDTNTEQDQEALHCLSCFSLFIPIGNGCFKIFQIFRRGKQNENTPSPQETSQMDNRQSPVETSQMENTQNSQEISSSETTPSPPEISQNTESPQDISQNEDTESPQKVSLSEDKQSPSIISHDEATQYPHKGSRDDNTHGLQQLSQNGDAQSQNESKQGGGPQKIPAARTNWIFSGFGFRKGKKPVEKGGHVSSVQDAAVPSASGTNGDHVDGAVMKLEEPGMSNIFSSTDDYLLNEVKDESKERKIDAGMLEKNDGDNEIEDLEAGLLEPSFSPRTDVEPSSESRTQTEGRAVGAGEAHEWEILKGIVYGGLVESITSVGVVSSAAGAGADTLNILALGLANLFGGLLVIVHNLRELKNDQPRVASSENDVEDRYQALLGPRQNFMLHATVAILSYIIFGLVPPVVYGFSFRKSDDKDLKFAAVAGASLVCIFLLALGKGHVKKPRRAYFQTVSYYVGLGITASGISYVIGLLIKRLLEQLGLFESSSVVNGMTFLGTIPMDVGRASY